jgi:NAD(P)-dependent dehydrogenase (short-subunit alcohol dehydrogenase family)
MRGIGLEIALAYAESGAIVYCIDRPEQPDADFVKVQTHVAGLPAQSGDAKGRLEYVSCDVTHQKETWAAVEHIVAKEGRVDVCVCNAGILAAVDVLEYPADKWKEVRSSLNIVDGSECPLASGYWKSEC